MSGLTKDHGDIDMAGTEDSPTLQQLKERLQKEINVVRDLRLDLLTVDGNPSLNRLENEVKSTLIKKVQDVVKIVTCRIRDVRKMKQTKEYNVKSMIDSFGGEKKWRGSKLVNAISKAKCEIVQMDEFIKTSLDLNKKVCLMARYSYGVGEYKYHTIDGLHLTSKT